MLPEVKKERGDEAPLSGVDGLGVSEQEESIHFKNMAKT